MPLINAFFQKFKVNKEVPNRAIFFLQIARQSKLKSTTTTKAKKSSSTTIDTFSSTEGKTLVIVESPAKARTIEKFLIDISQDHNYIIDFSAGHVRELISTVKDLPPDFESSVVCEELNLKTASLGIDVFHGFTPIYKISEGKSTIIKRLKAHLKVVDKVLFATDEDREGEAISWHLLDVLKPKVPYKRAVFHEITKSAIFEAFQNPRDIEMNLVNAQEARALLDKLTGYTLSPVLWKYLAYGLSAGRVQSCGLHLIIEREKQRWKFVPSNYYSISAYFSIPGNSVSNDLVFLAKLTKWNGKKIANEKDFDGGSGKVKSNQTVVLDEEKSVDLLKWLSDANHPIFSIVDRTEKVSTQNPAVPYITSSLQQDASRKLGLSPARTMRVAQGLYESGYITYMRTDSPTLSSLALDAIQKLVSSKYGDEYLSTKSKKESSTPKNAQEAHEAIRPALIDNTFKTSSLLKLSGDDARLYDLIYKRTIASQMKEAKSLTVSYTIDALDRFDEMKNATFRFSKTKLLFNGFLAAWGKSIEKEGKVTKKLMDMKIGQVLNLFRNETQIESFVTVPSEEDEDSEVEETETAEGAVVPLSAHTEFPGFLSTAHTTRAPTRFTEASFIQELEAVGVGRPSTYSTILQTLKDREYILVDKRTIIPTVKGIGVSNFLQNHFSEFINEEFTASMEKSLDLIAHGKQNKESFLESFYLGGKLFPNEQNSKRIDSSSFPLQHGLLRMIEEKIRSSGFERLDAVEIPDIKALGPILLRKDSLYFLFHCNDSETGLDKEIFIKLPDEMKDIRQITKESMTALIARYQDEIKKHPVPIEGTNFILGQHPSTKKPIKLKFGRYGRYLEMNERRVSVPKWMHFHNSTQNASVLNDPAYLTFEKAIALLSLPISIGIHPILQTEISLSCYYGELAVSLNGTGSTESCPIPDGFFIDDVRNNRENILENLIYPKLQELESKKIIGYWQNVPDHFLSHIGAVRNESSGLAILFQVGRFGPYLRCGKLNCALNEKLFSSKEDVTLEVAIELFVRKIERNAKKEAKLVTTPKVTSNLDESQDADLEEITKATMKRRARKVPKLGGNENKEASEKGSLAKPAKKILIPKAASDTVDVIEDIAPVQKKSRKPRKTATIAVLENDSPTEEVKSKEP